jgi:hypothetical protein
VFDLLGSGPVHLGQEIDWHLDFKAGYRWNPGIPHVLIRAEPLPVGVDIKVPWELSRCLHFSSLGLADWITGDAKYYAEFKRQVTHWIESNPVGMGVNWACTMDVGIRAVNWINAAMLFGQRIAQESDKLFLRKLHESLWHHGIHVKNNLEWSGPRGRLCGNHLIADLTGLLALGILFHQTRVGSGWWSFSKYHLEREIVRQVNPDGTNYENSTSYHRLVMEMFLWAASIAERSGPPFSPGYNERLSRMSRFVSAYTAPSGSAVQFGDNDSGRLVTTGICVDSDHRYLVAGRAGFGGLADRLLLRGSLAMPSLPSDCDGGFLDGGYWFLRRGSAWLGIRAGKVSEGGGHAHCDQLSIVLNLEGQDFLVDRGTGTYTPDLRKRNHYRATAHHSTMKVNGWEQNYFGEGRSAVFSMRDDTRTDVVSWVPGGKDACLVARHHGYESKRAGLLCRRSLTLSERHLRITDSITLLRSGDEVAWAFHFSPQARLSLSANSLAANVNGTELTLLWAPELSAVIEEGYHSSAYGVEVLASCLRLEKTVATDGGDDFNFEFSWTPETAA